MSYSATAASLVCGRAGKSNSTFPSPFKTRRARKGLPARERKPEMTSFVFPSSSSWRAISGVSVRPATRFQMTKPQPGSSRLFHLAQLLVVDELAGGLHRGEKGRLGVAGRRPGLLGLDLCDGAFDLLPLLERGQLGALVLGVFVLACRLLVGLGEETVDPAPTRLERDLAARAEALVLDQGDDGGTRVSSRWMEH